MEMHPEWLRNCLLARNLHSKSYINLAFKIFEVTHRSAPLLAVLHWLTIVLVVNLHACASAIDIQLGIRRARRL